MSLGLGIFLSALLLVAAWQIDKRKAWKKSLLWIAVPITVLGGCLGAWLWWESGSSDRENAKVAKQIQADQLREYWGLELGMPKNEVKYLKGEPDQVVAWDDGEGSIWAYEAEGRYQIDFDKADQVKLISCSEGATPFAACEQIAGIGLRTGETEILSRLGAPTTSEGPDASGLKYMEFGSGNRVTFGLRKQNALVLAIGEGRTLRWKLDPIVSDAKEEAGTP